MRNYFNARKSYLWGVMVSIAICMYMYVFQVGFAERIFGDDDLVALFWPGCMIALYGILAKIRSVVSDCESYYGGLRVIPKIFIGYMVLSTLPGLISWLDWMF